MPSVQLQERSTGEYEHERKEQTDTKNGDTNHQRNRNKLMIPELAELSGLSPSSMEHKEDRHCGAVSAETWTVAPL